VSRVLVIEDDIEVAAEIASHLSLGGFSPEQCFDGRLGLEMALSGRFDAITLDRVLPGCDGLSVVKAIREAGLETPVLMISAMGDVDERVAGLRGGGDDYLTKPFAPAELVVRLENLVRRHARSAKTETRLVVGDLELDLFAREARRRGRAIELLPTEFKLLEFMMRNAGRMLSRQVIFEKVWEYYFDPGTNLIDVHIGRLRRKIDEPGEASIITTQRGAGYVLNAA
jgi:two-component system OmpR family response regulator